MTCVLASPHSLCNWQIKLGPLLGTFIYEPGCLSGAKVGCDGKPQWADVVAVRGLVVTASLK